MSTQSTTETPLSDLPAYGSKPKSPGLYLGLFHGRDNPGEKMEAWGFTGPMIGPLTYCHTTYATQIKLQFDCHTDAVRYFGECNGEVALPMDGDMVVFRGRYFGDWTVFFVKPEDCERPADSFRQSHRANHLLAHQRLQPESHAP
jgi:hypothetical protein